jgi:ABC-type nitrate/sulfonate/bicarbonate transport system substrate-binding protein
VNRTLAITVAFVLAAAACSGPQSPGDAADGPTADGPSAPATHDAPAAERDVTVMLDWTPNTNHAGLYLADANGWYADAGLNVEFLQPGEQGGLPALASGDAQFAVSVQEELTPARAQGAPVVSIAAIIASNTSSLIAQADEGISRPRDLAGHRYGGFGGDLETELIDTLVECDGGDADAVEFVEVGNVDYRAGLERDFYDVVWIFEGWDGIRLRQAGMDVVTLPFSDYFDCIPDWYTPLLATSEAMIDSDPDVVTEFVDATARGYEAAIADPGAAADALLAAAPELDEQLVRESADYLAEHYAASDRPWGVQEDQTWQAFTDFLRQAGVLEGEFDVAAAYTNDFLPAGPTQAASP